MNLLIVHVNPHVAHAQDIFILGNVSKPPTPILGGHNPSRVCHHLVNLLEEIINWLGWSNQSSNMSF